jgi:adenylate cyclase
LAPEKDVTVRVAPILKSMDEESSESSPAGKGRWVPPASWNAPSDLRDDQVDWNIRITKRDTTFATITCAPDITAAELCLILGKKFFIRRDDSYQLYLRVKGMEWHLEPDEQPILLEENYLKALGYTAADHLEQQGRKDHGYLFNFIYADRPHNHDKQLPPIGDGKIVNVAGLNLETLPVSVFKQAHLTESLNMSKNPRIDFPLDFAETCSSLTTLNLSECEYNRAPRAISVVDSLQKLDISRNHLLLCPPAFGKLINLIELDLKGNLLSALPRELETLTPKLTVLNLSNNNFETIPSVVFSLINLKVLDMSFCRLSSVSQQIQYLTNLTILRLPGNMLTQLPNTISKMILVELDLRHNQMQDAMAVEEINTLKKLCLENNSISSHRIYVSHVSVTQLTLSYNSLTRFEVIPVSTLLVTLTLSHNKLLTLPDMFHAMANLETLELDNNHISALPNMKSLKKLKTLNLSNNDLGELPNEIGDLSKLEYLDVHSNNLKGLPPTIWKLGNLVVLNANSNLIEKFPDTPDFSLILAKV